MGILEASHLFEEQGFELVALVLESRVAGQVYLYVADIAVGAPRDDDGGLNRGAMWVLFLDAAGSVTGHQKISDTTGGFLGALDDGDEFGMSATSVGDLDGDTVTLSDLRGKPVLIEFGSIT